MDLSLCTALRLLPRAERKTDLAAFAGRAIAFVGAGGKTTAILSIARELPGPTLITTTTHIGQWQIRGLGRHVVAVEPQDVSDIGREEVTIITGPALGDGRLPAPSEAVLATLRRRALREDRTLLIEADGARQKPLKAPREHEPQIPDFVEAVVVVAGLVGLGHELTEAVVHSSELFGGLSGLESGSSISEGAITRVLTSPYGGLKCIPPRARRIALLNQADTADLKSAGKRMSAELLRDFDAVLVATAQTNSVHACYEPAAGIILAAGGASRYGRAKQLLTWKGEALIRRAIRAAIQAGLMPVVVVTGAQAEEVEAAIRDLPVIVARNEGWARGQAGSVRRGLDACPAPIASAVFLLADQPFVNAQVVTTLLEAHASERTAIVAPMLEGDRRGNPVLFDRETFAELRRLQGEEGGRAIFSKYRVHFVPWQDARLGVDIDTEQDYRKLLEEEQG